MTDRSRDQPVTSTFGGIGGRLLLAMLCLSALPILAASVGWISKSGVQEPLDQAFVRNLRFSDYQVQAQGLSQMLFGLVIYDLDKSIASSAEQDARAQSLLTQFEALAPLLDEAVEELRSQDGGETMLGLPPRPFNDTVTRIATLVQAALRMVEQASDDRQRLVTQRAAISDAVLQIENITSKPAGFEETVYERALNIRASARRLLVLTSVMEAESVIRAAANDYAATLRDMVSEAATLPANDLKRELSDPLSQLFDLGSSEQPAGYFYTELETVEIKASFDATRRDLQSLREQLNSRLIVVEETNNTIVRELVLRADRQLDRMRVALLAVAVFSVVIAFCISYFYIFKKLIKRIRRLSAATRQLSHGNLAAPVEQDGDDELTDIARALEVFRDRSRRLAEHEEVLVARTSELEQVNADLDKFAYVASHDLRAPLRAVENLLGFLHEDVGDGLPADSRKHLEIVMQRVQRLDALLTSLLDYSRAGRAKQPLERVDVLECVSDCAQMVADEHFTVTVQGSNDVVFTYRTPFELVIRNLLDNAQKHHDQETGQIVVSVQRGEGEVVVSVADDGAGIPRQFQQRVFEMFQTLKPRDDVEGSGMGLSILLKTVEAYGGSVELVSDPDVARGTECIVRWPVFEAHEVPAAALDAMQI